MDMGVIKDIKGTKDMVKQLAHREQDKWSTGDTSFFFLLTLTLPGPSAGVSGSLTVTVA